MRISGDLVIIKSQVPFNPLLLSTVKSTPENKLTCSRNCRRKSTKIGAIINSERAF